jgi:hypothetical protein
MEPEGSLPHLQVHAPVSILSQLNPIHNPTSRFLKIHLNIILPFMSGSHNDLFPSGFHTKTLYTPLPYPIRVHTPPISLFSILSPTQ